MTEHARSRIQEAINHLDHAQSEFPRGYPEWKTLALIIEELEEMLQIDEQVCA